MRTILSGNSLYDQVRKAAGKDARLTAKHFQPFLQKYATLEALDRKDANADDVAAELERGHELFFAKKCHLCHSGWNFTDNGFHNIGIRESLEPPLRGEELGRFPHAPYGLKDKYLIGAFKTPSLRNLPRTGPYFHDASAATLTEVIEYYNRHVPSATEDLYLAPELDDPSSVDPRRLNLDEKGVRALEVFLRALDGEAIPVEIGK
jgi:cytochrome c peroxidase